MAPRRCLGCPRFTRSGSYCDDCKRARKKIRNDDRPIASAVRAADPICRCESDCAWHDGMCGATENLTADHVRAIAHGGTNAGERQVLCNRCNARKGARMGV
jgi:5-methylcytosine-specific restriction endonuclease McrA